MQGGIHPNYTGETYLDILHAVKEAAPDIHVHAFSPLEVWQGAATLGIGLEDYHEQTIGRLGRRPRHRRNCELARDKAKCRFPVISRKLSRGLNMEKI